MTSVRSTWHHTVTRPGGALLTPTAVAALGVLVLNDHVLKRLTPGPLTGKLSDLAGLVLLPLVLVAIAEMVAGRRVPGASLVAVVVSATAFAAWQVVPSAAELYRSGLGAAQVLLPWIDRGGAPVAHTADPSDLLALPAVILAVLAERRRLSGAAPSSRRGS